jgi:hypothetical protein
MRVNFEIAIDLDDKRRIWMETATDVENVEGVAPAAAGLCSATCAATIEVWEKVERRHTPSPDGTEPKARTFD